MHLTGYRSGLLAGACGLTLLTSPAFAQTVPEDAAASSATASDANTQSRSGKSGQANDADSLTTADIVVTAIVDTSPVTVSPMTTQPQAIISRGTIENVLPATADFNAIAILSPGVTIAGNNNGPGLGESKIQIRGFQDGEYNVTYDSIPFSDTNNPTHHSTSFFPASTIETLVVDRGPGNASQLGQSTYGGNLNMYSRAAADKSGVAFNLTGGSFSTLLAEAEIQSGTIAGLGGARVVVTGSLLRSDGALTNQPAFGQNIFAKTVVPIGAHNTFTLLGTYNHSINHVSDTGFATCGNPTSIMGENCAATSTIGLYGKNYGLTGDPSPTSQYAQSFRDYNRTNKTSDFEIARLQSDLGGGITLDNRLYTFAYVNRTRSGQDASGGTANTVTLTPGGTASVSVPGYNKLSRYRNWGYIGQVNYDFGPGRLRVGGWYEHSSSLRSLFDIDLSTGASNYREKPLVYMANGGLVPNGTPQPAANIRYLQNSGWDQYQLFSELALQPLRGLEITPGIKYVNFTRSIDASVNQTSRTPIDAKATFTRTLPFLTINYSASGTVSLYGQYAQGMYVPDISSFYSPVPTLLTSLSSLKPQTTTNYQAGVVYHGKAFAIDGDVYLIEVNNKIAANPIGDGTLINIGRVRYKGVEGQISYYLSRDLTLFANGSLAEAKNRATGQQIAASARDTALLGVLFHRNGIFASFTQKFTGPQWGNEYNGLPGSRLYHIAAYSVGAVDLSYTFSRYRIGINVANLLNDRSLTALGANPKGAPTTKVNGVPIQSGYGPYDSLLFNAPRSVLVTLRVAL